METVLHIVVNAPAPLLDELIARQRERAERSVAVVDLRAPQPDYDRLLEQIFAADSVHVW